MGDMTVWTRSAFSVAVLAAGLLSLGLGFGALHGGIEASPLHALVWHYVMLAFVAVGIIVAFFRRDASRAIWDIVFSLVTVAGAWYAIALLLPTLIALCVAGVLTFLALQIPASRNGFVVLGIAGLSFAVASWLPTEALIAGLAVLVVYDMVVASKGRNPVPATVQQRASSFVAEVVIPPGQSFGILTFVLPYAAALSLLPFAVWAPFVVIAASAGFAFPATEKRAREEYAALGAAMASVLILLISRLV